VCTRSAVKFLVSAFADERTHVPCYVFVPAI
jgi:hypothetical protein